MTMKKQNDANEMNSELTTMTGFSMLSDTELIADVTADLQGLTLKYDRIRIPAGGLTAFEVPGDDEEAELVKDIKGVILYHHPAFAYYASKYAGGNNRPDCGSFDGVQGVGTPGGSCANCPLNQFGSSEEGMGKACKNRRTLYILRENELFPMTLSLPTGSLKEFTKFLKRQLSRGRLLNRIVTKISLQKATNTAGIAYSQAVFSFDRFLTTEEQQAIAPIVTQAKNYAAHLTIDALTEHDEGPIIDMETGEIITPLK